MAAICPNCASPLRYDPSHKALICGKCGGSFAPETVRAESRDLLEKQEITNLSDVLGSYADEPEEMADFNVYTCNNCGGEIVITSTEASTYCIYCGNPSIVFSRVSKFRKPKYILPFSITKESAEGIIRNTLKTNKYIPDEIKNFKVDSVRGIYIPYQIVNVEYRDAMFLSSVVKSGKHSYTYFHTRAGACMFSDLPIESSSKLADGTSMKLEPYDLRGLVKFDEDYLTGFYSDMCDLTRVQLDMTIKKRLGEMYFEEVTKDVVGKSEKILYSHPYIQHLRAPIYAMLPVWFLTFFYEGKHHTILVNGQTGKVVCGLPWSKSSIVREMLLISAALFFLIFILCIFLAQIIWPYMLLTGILSLLSGIYKFKELKKSIEQTQSQATFGFVKRRQG